METKTNKALAYFNAGEYGKAFRIFKTFKFGFSKRDMRSIEIACDCFHGYWNFYVQLGIDTTKEKDNAISIIKKRYKLA